MKAVKKPLTVSVTFAEAAGSMSTLEGEIAFEAGDAILEGPTEDSWPLPREQFDREFEPVIAGATGQPGAFTKIRKVVDARRTSERECVRIRGRSLMHAKPGDWVVTAGDGSQWVVAPHVFASTYEPASEA